MVDKDLIADLFKVVDEHGKGAKLKNELKRINEEIKVFVGRDCIE